MYHPKKVSKRYSDALTQLSWQGFEHLIAEFYAGQGYRVEHVGTGDAGTRFDGGIDLKLYRDDRCVIVQCKHWNVHQVTHNPVHELLGVMLTQHATGCIVVTSGEFTRAAKAAAAEDLRMTLIDGAALRSMLGPIAGMFVPSATEELGRGREPGMYDASPRSRRPSGGGLRLRRRNPLAQIAYSLVIGLAGYALIQHAISGIRLTRVTPAGAAVVQQPPVTRLYAGLPWATITQSTSALQQPRKGQVTHMSPAQQRAWQHKNDEAMKILERTTAPLAR